MNLLSERGDALSVNVPHVAAVVAPVSWRPRVLASSISWDLLNDVYPMFEPSPPRLIF